MEKINRLNIGDHLLEYQLAIIGKTVEEAKALENWFTIWTITTEQQKGFEKYAIPLLKKVLHINGRKAKYTLGWFIADVGLRVKD